jgi:transcriptional regulator with XRE-family HTH domain
MSARSKPKVEPAEKGPQSTTDIDRHVGKMMRVFRVALDKSQQEVGNAIGGVAFQQVQKYEKGTNRISCGRLWLASRFFEKSVADFFPATDDTEGESITATLLAEKNAMDLLRAWATFNTQQRAIVMGVISHMGANAS